MTCGRTLLDYIVAEEIHHWHCIEAGCTRHSWGSGDTHYTSVCWHTGSDPTTRVQPWHVSLAGDTVRVLLLSLKAGGVALCEGWLGGGYLETDLIYDGFGTKNRELLLSDVKFYFHIVTSENEISYHSSTLIDTKLCQSDKATYVVQSLFFINQ